MEHKAILEEYFKDFHSMMSELCRIEHLKKELHKRRLKYIRLHNSCNKKKKELSPKLTEDERDAIQQIQDQIFKSLLEQYTNGKRATSKDDSWQLEEEDKVLVIFDIKDRPTPNAIVTYLSSNRPSIFVDIAASVKKEPRNIGHPLVVAIIERYIQALARIDDSDENSMLPSKEVAKTRLDKISSALLESAKVRRSQLKEHNRFLQALVVLGESTYNEDYFSLVWRILKEPQSKSYKRRGLTSNWLSRIKSRLNQEYPNIDHTKTLSFLEKSSDLPKKGGGRALKNAFNAFEYQLSIQSVKIYKSRASNFLDKHPSIAENGYQFSDKEVDQITEDWMRKYFGTDAIENDLDLTETELAWEFWREDQDKTTCQEQR